MNLILIEKVFIFVFLLFEILNNKGIKIFDFCNSKIKPEHNEYPWDPNIVAIVDRMTGGGCS